MSRQATAAEVGAAIGMVAPAEAAFRSRWRMTTLERINRDLHDRLAEQIALYGSALISASSDELTDQSAAMVRGWAAGCRAMEAQSDVGQKSDGPSSSSSGAQPHDAYLTGLDWASKTRVVVSNSKQSIDHIQHEPGVRVLAVTPDEIAKLLGRIGIVSLTKATFPDAEIIDATTAAA